MKPASRLIYLKHRGSVLIISMIFVAMFSALVVSMATMAGTNVQIATNQHNVNCARASAESGQEITSADATFENIRVVAGTNPNFTGHATLKGIVFIEAPNVVTFSGGTTITGIIIGNGYLYFNRSGTSHVPAGFVPELILQYDPTSYCPT